MESTDHGASWRKDERKLNPPQSKEYSLSTSLPLSIGKGSSRDTPLVICDKMNGRKEGRHCGVEIVERACFN